MKYSVLLLYPDTTNRETYFNHTEAENPDEAIQNVQNMASEANSGDIGPDEFYPLAVFEGHIDMELGANDF